MLVVRSYERLGTMAPLSAGCLEMNTWRERRTEKRVRDAEGMTRVGVAVDSEHGMSEAVFPHSDLRRGRIGLAVGNVLGGVCHQTSRSQKRSQRERDFYLETQITITYIL
jgi:hypothetical protein